MKENSCEYEQSLVKGLASGKQNKELAAHLSGCPDCREALKIAGWMQAFAAGSQPQALPKPGFIRWKAQLIEKRSKAEQATRPIVWTQMATVVLVAAAVVWGLATNQSQLAPTAKVLFESLELVATPLLIGFSCAVFACLAFAFKWRQPAKRK